MKEKTVELIYDHYKDTFEIQQKNLYKRNYYTFLCIGLIGLLSFSLSYPEESGSISNELIKKNIGDFTIHFSFINNILTFGLLWMVMLYYQMNLQIERIYKYLHKLESEMTEAIRPFEISREGKTYFDNYPWLLSLVHRIYTIGFPITLISVVIIKWFIERSQSETLYGNGHFLFNTIFILAIILISLLYLSYRHFNDFKKKNMASVGNMS